MHAVVEARRRQFDDLVAQLLDVLIELRHIIDDQKDIAEREAGKFASLTARAEHRHAVDALLLEEKTAILDNLAHLAYKAANLVALQLAAGADRADMRASSKAR